MNKKYIYITLTIIIVLIVAIILLTHRQKPIINPSDNWEIFEFENSEEYKKELKKILSECENDYQDAYQKADVYQRSDFYNSSRIENSYYDGRVDFSNLEANGTKIIDYYGNEVENLPVPIYKGNPVEISDYTELIINHYYLIKYQSYNNSSQVYYYIGKLTDTGFEDLEFYCITDETLGIEIVLEDQI
ncbi:MAG: hypothetical protein IJ867_00175 [Clostridia bacterium]|nr:hypothetical protein [Clostridia bacterium]